MQETGLTRREFAIGAASVGALFGLGAVLGPAARAFAEGDGGGEGDWEGDAPGGDAPSYYGFEWVWFDKGGFESTESGRKYVPEQGWDKDSRDRFWDKYMRTRLNEVGTHLFGSGYRFAFYSGDRNAYNAAADAALQAARDRAGTQRARVVAVGWTCGYNTGVDIPIGRVYKNEWSGGRTRDNVLRTSAAEIYTNASSTEDTGYKFAVGNSIRDLGAGMGDNNGGWSDKAVTKTGEEYATWYDYLEHIFKSSASATSDSFVFIVLAVADGEPGGPGYMKLKKTTA